jgi:hypothetical protein
MSNVPAGADLACTVPGDCLNGPGPHEYDAGGCCTQPWEALARARCWRCMMPITLWMGQRGVWRDDQWMASCGTGREAPMHEPVM